jgi:hypothetical protein
VVDEAELVVAGELHGEIKLHVLCRPVLLWTMGARSEVEWGYGRHISDRRIVRTWREQFQIPADYFRFLSANPWVHMRADYLFGAA